MKLYYSPGACSMAVHIVLREAGYRFDLEKVDLAAGKTESGEDYSGVNPNGYVPALKLEDGEILTEATVILQYLADQRPASGLAPEAGSMERYRLMEWLNFLSSEIHKTLGALYNPNITPEWKAHQISLFGRRCDYLTSRIDVGAYLTGKQFTVADAYLFTLLSWPSVLGIDVSRWPGLTDYRERVGARPAVQQTLQAEGLKS